MKKKTVSDNPYSVTIIGSGNIGAFYDDPDSVEILTHAHAFSVDSRFDLIGFYDVDAEKAKKAAAIWGAKAFDSYEVLFQNRCDVVVVAVSDPYHFEVLQHVVKADGVKVIVLEKPVADSFENAEKIHRLCENRTVLVNFSRRFDRTVQELRSDYLGKKMGKFVCGSAYYGKGFRHNASHIINLLQFLFDDRVEPVAKFDSHSDFYENDPSICGLFRINEEALFCLHAVDNRHYWIFEVDLLFEKKRFRFVNSGFEVEIYQVKENPVYHTSDLLFEKSMPTQLNGSMTELVHSVYNVLNNGEGNVSSLERGYKTELICKKMFDLP